MFSVAFSYVVTGLVICLILAVFFKFLCTNSYFLKISRHVLLIAFFFSWYKATSFVNFHLFQVVFLVIV